LFAAATTPRGVRGQTPDAPFDLSLVPNETMVALWAKPAALAKNPEVAKLYNMLATIPNGPVTSTTPKLEQVEELRLIQSFGFSRGNREPADLVVVRLNDPQEFPKYFEKIIKSSKFEEVKVPELPKPLHVIYPLSFRFENGKAVPDKSTNWRSSRGAVYQLDDRTMLQNTTWPEIIVTALKHEREFTKPSWTEHFSPELRKAQAAIILDLVMIRDQIRLVNKAKQIPPPIAEFLEPLWDNAKFVAGRVNSNDGLQFVLEFHSSDNDAAAITQKSLAGFLELAKKSLPMLQPLAAQGDQLAAGQGTKLMKSAESLLQGAKLSMSEKVTTLTLTVPQQSLNEIATSLNQVLDAAMQK